MAKPRLIRIHQEILALLKDHPQGISEGEMRAALRIKPEEQVQFGRRRRDLHYHYKIDKKRIGPKTVYIYRGPLKKPRDAEAIDTKNYALVLNAAHGHCLHVW